LRTSSVRNFLYAARHARYVNPLLRLLAVLQSRGFGQVPHCRASGESLQGHCGETSTGCAAWATPYPRPPGRRWLSLGQGTALPPLLLDDEGRGHRGFPTQCRDTFAGMSRRRWVRWSMNQLLPARLRKRVSALHAVRCRLAGTTRNRESNTLTTLAAACRDRQQITLRYQDRGAGPRPAPVEPLRLAHTGNRRWYWWRGTSAVRRGALAVDRIDEKLSWARPSRPGLRLRC